MPINETLKFDVNWNGSNRASATTIINDTSRPEYEYSLVASTGSTTPITEIDIPTYVLTANKSTMNEGESVIFSLTTTKLDPGTIIPFTITGITVADITADSLTGNFVIDATGKASLTIVTIADYVTEVNMNMVVTLDNLGISQSVTLNDTSRTPSYDFGWYSDNTGTNAINTTNEGDVLFLVIKTQNVNNGTVINISLTGSGVTAGDFVKNALTFPMTVNNNIAFVDLTTVADAITEGNEVVTAAGAVGGTGVGSASVTIIDTSQKPIIPNSVDIEIVQGTDVSGHNGNWTIYGAGDRPGVFQYPGSKVTQVDTPIVLGDYQFNILDINYGRTADGSTTSPPIVITTVSGTPPEYIKVVVDEDPANTHRLRVWADSFVSYLNTTPPNGYDNLSEQIKSRYFTTKKMKLTFLLDS